MVMSWRRSTLRFVLGGLLAFGFVNAVAGGYYGISGAEGVPVEWLEGTPFDDYLVPSLILLTVVGGAFLLGAIAVFSQHRTALAAAAAAGIILLVWIAVQVSMIGLVSWMQPASALFGLILLALVVLAAGSTSPLGNRSLRIDPRRRWHR